MKANAEEALPVMPALASYGSIEGLRSQVIACAMSFEDANRRGDAHIDVEIDDLSVEQLTEIELADDDYNRTKASLFTAVRALRMAVSFTSTPGEAP